MKPPYCRVCHRPHWQNQPCQGSPDDWNQEIAISRGLIHDGTVSGVGSEKGIAEPHDGDGLTVMPVDSATSRLLEFLKANPGAEQATIKKSVKARWQDVRKALSEFCRRGVVSKSGAGTRNSGFRYSVKDE